MPTQARCDRVPPPHAKWDALDLRVLQEDDLPLDL
ncbi:unnamed protein product [Spodoptera littoralis]|uniref:Uncharacterized protein n=1 Tax=Spodoptera littoralis TaxID=7109 RepID=A0A9P0I8I6_SPOLI|nr:unnamed protein product [Spodoptera littoralis]CAH1642187.1 unnamed protein product [Spodoptera littoralis]